MLLLVPVWCNCCLFTAILSCCTAASLAEGHPAGVGRGVCWAGRQHHQQVLLHHPGVLCTNLQWQSAVHLLLHRLSRRQAHTTVPPPLLQDAAALSSNPHTPFPACAGLCQRSTASQLGRPRACLPLSTAQAAFQRQPAHPTARRWVQSSTVCLQPHAYVRGAGLRCKHHTPTAPQFPLDSPLVC